MTNKEKRERKKFRDELREKGILPPPKKRLNRQKYAIHIKNRYDNMECDPMIFQIYVLQAISLMTPPEGIKISVTSEQIGVLKMLHMAMDLYEFERRKKNEGSDHYTVQEVYEEVIKPIWKL